MMIINYKMKGRIYCLYYPHDENEQVYIGSTTRELKKRLWGHNSKYERWKRGEQEATTNSFILMDKYGKDNIKIKLLEEVEVNDKKELERIEGQWIERSNCVNQVVAGRTNQEWTEDNNEHLKEYRRQYYSRPDVKERQKEKRKNYLKERRQEITQQQADYRKKNASNCPKCGKYVLGGCMKRHDRYNH